MLISSRPVPFYLRAQAVRRHSQPTGHIRRAVVATGDLANRCALEFFGATFVAYKHLSDSHSVWLKDVTPTGGD